MDFPHLKDSTPFPTADTHVYRYRNEFDYGRYQRNVRIKVCRVPWCGDYENVVKFADEAARDAYLDSLEGVEFETMFNVVPSTSVKVPVPTTSMQLYNYLVVDLPMVTSEADPIEYADSPRISRYAYFIDGVSQRASSTCECAVRMDVWTTYIEHVEFRYAMLERGHAPMAATDLDAYLEHPAENNRYLLAPDVNLGEDPCIYVRDHNTIYFNCEEDMWLVICTDSPIVGRWGDMDALTARTPAYYWNTTEGQPAPMCYGIEPEDAQGFFTAVGSECPQFMATIKCVFVVNKSLVMVNPDDNVSGEFCGYYLTRLTAVQSVRDVLDVREADFGFPEEYRRIAKLYTYPYSCIRIYSEDGTQQVVHIENLTDPLQVRLCTNLIWPWLAIDTCMLNIAGVNETTTIEGAHASWPFTSGGNFASYFKRHEIPCFYVWQSGEDHATWAHLYDREQARIAAENDYESATAMAQANYDNMVAAANTSYNNSVNSANNITAVAALTVAANNDMLDESQTLLNETTFASNTKLVDDRRADQDLADANYAADLDSNAVAADNNTATTDASTTSVQVSALLGGAATGAAVGSAVPGMGTALGAMAGAAASLFISTVATDVATTQASSAATNASLEIALTNLESIYDAAYDAAVAKSSNATSYLWDYHDAKRDYLDNTTAIQNSLTTSNAAQNADLIITNAANSRATEIANAGRTRDAALTTASNNRSTALSAIENERLQQGLDAPWQCGQAANGETAATRPLGVWAQVVTESDAGIKYAGDNFLRYGYALDAEWDIGELQVMRHFTYWRCSDVWCAGSKAVVEAAQQTLKDIMKAGVTVWSDPDEIGQVSIYDNFDG